MFNCNQHAKIIDKPLIEAAFQVSPTAVVDPSKIPDIKTIITDKAVEPSATLAVGKINIKKAMK